MSSSGISSGGREYIKEFLVGVGFDIDANKITQFTKTMGLVSKVVGGVATTAIIASSSTVAFAAKMAVGLEDLYWATQRIGTSIAGIKGYEFAISNFGGTADGARTMLEGLASAIRSNPATEGILNSLGVMTRDPKTGAWLDRVQVITQLGQKLRSMPFFQAKSYAEMLGVYTSDPDLLALMRGPGADVQHVADLYKKLGIDQNKLARDSHEFMNNWRNLETTINAVADKLEQDLLPSMNKLVTQANTYFGKPESDPTGFLGSWDTIKDWYWDAMAGVGYPTKGHDGGGPWNISGVAGREKWNEIYGRVPEMDSAWDEQENKQEDREHRTALAMAFFKKVGWSRAQASGIVANLLQESGLLSVPEDHGTAFGIAQWNGDRQAQFKKLFGHNIQKSTVAEQLAFVQYELTKGAFQWVGKSLAYVDDPGEAGAIISNAYERPAINGAMLRGKLARELYNEVTVHQTNTTTIHGSSNPHEAAKEVSKTQKQNNGDLLRKLKGAAR